MFTSGEVSWSTFTTYKLILFLNYEFPLWLVLLIDGDLVDPCFELSLLGLSLFLMFCIDLVFKKFWCQFYSYLLCTYDWNTLSYGNAEQLILLTEGALSLGV